MSCVVLLILLYPVFASTDIPPKYRLIQAQDILLAKVESVSGDSVVFSITEVLKGKAHSPLNLTREIGLGEVFKPGEELILCWMGDASAKGVVCSSVMEGTPEWFSIAVQRDGGNVTVSGIGSLEKAKEICASKSP